VCEPEDLRGEPKLPADHGRQLPHEFVGTGEARGSDRFELDQDAVKWIDPNDDTQIPALINQCPGYLRFALMGDTANEGAGSLLRELTQISVFREGSQQLRQAADSLPEQHDERRVPGANRGPVQHCVQPGLRGGPFQTLPPELLEDRVPLQHIAAKGRKVRVAVATGRLQLREQEARERIHHVNVCVEPCASHKLA